MPEDRGRFAALLGMLRDEATDSHAVDFLHPRRPPRPVSGLRMGLIGGGVVAAVALAIVVHVWSTLSSINSDNRALASQLKELKLTARKAVTQKKLIEEIVAWNGREVNWLDELRDLSIRFPGSRDAVILRMSLRPSQSGGGVIDMEGLVRDPKVVMNMERQIRDEYHRVRSPRITERAIERDYTWLFETSMAVAPRSKDRYVSHLPEEEQATVDGDTSTTADGSDGEGDAP